MVSMNVRRMIAQANQVLAVVLICGTSTGAAAEAEYRCGQCRSCEQGNHCHGLDRDPGRPGKPFHTKPGDVDQGDCPPYRYRMNDCQRAGNPHRIAPWAKCGVNEKYSAWFVGGGAAYAGLPRLPAGPKGRLPVLERGRHRKANGCGQHGEGTWGLDYGGLFGKANVWLKYTHGRYQNGEGAYETDGEPELLEKLKSRFGLH